MKTSITEARRLWTTTPRRDWAAEIQRYPTDRGICSQEGVRQALRLALSAAGQSGSYQGMDAENRFVTSTGSEQVSHEQA